MKRYHSTVVVCDCRLQKIVGNLYVTFPSGGAQLIFALDFRDFCHLLSANLGPSSSHNGVKKNSMSHYHLKSFIDCLFDWLDIFRQGWVTITYGGAQLIFALNFRDFCHLLSANLCPSSTHNGVSEILKSKCHTFFQTLRWLLSNLLISRKMATSIGYN